jgi:hypothetical protein
MIPAIAVVSKKKSNEASDKSKPKSFSTTAFRKEVNMLAKSSSKRKVLDLYSAAVAKEKAKLSKKSKKNEDESSASDTDMSVQIMDMTDPIPKKKIRFCEQTEEEKAFLKKIQKEDDESNDN